MFSAAGLEKIYFLVFQYAALKSSAIFNGNFSDSGL